MNDQILNQKEYPNMNIDQLNSYLFKGFLSNDEALCLYELAREASRSGPCLEIGSYCGKSAAYIGMGCKENSSILFSIDHHRGSEEQQEGHAYFDPELLDCETGRIDTFNIFRKVITALSLEDTVVPIVAKSDVVAKSWATPLSMVFIDGGHTFEAVFKDYNCWVPHLLPGGYLVIHDIFPDPAKGGQAPYCIYHMALSSGLFNELPMMNTMGILKRVFCDEITHWAIKKWRQL
jgi:predicted O-methyltransferase YrrM